MIVDKGEKLDKLKTEQYDYVVISQEKLQTTTYVDKIIASKFDFLIVDEVHKLKNIATGKRANGLLRITEDLEKK